ncbi:glycosyltransferase [Oceanihabitans sp. 2_MG-2023]|uniref:glycosyltransferase n=1 Tax=Oceanihabitans sp. 2_MG-2023 TaxID=3062661 RepID=UPI0026E3F166|nr:glycosyltransferase [Oceanihabitans sp. 2_MG-2023]MDO6597674.1 glycosyltransferase [Oceanihabitans sp. 2_MG-2023]
MSKSKNPVVSICMITYGHEAFIKQAIESVLMQHTNFDFELIIADDCSPDNTKRVVEEIQNSNNKGDCIVYYRHLKNKGVMANFAFALNKCQGKYIALLEGDDYWVDELKLQKQFDFLEHNTDYVLSCHNASVLDENGLVINDSLLEANRQLDFTGEELMIGRHIVTLSMCFRNVIKEFPESFLKCINGDTLLVSMLGEYGGSKFQSELKNGVYRIHAGGVWSAMQESKRIKEKNKTFYYQFKYFKSKGNKKVKNTLFKKYFSASKSLMKLLWDSNAYLQAIKLYLKIYFNCIRNGYIRKSFQITKFFFTTTLKI